LNIDRPPAVVDTDVVSFLFKTHSLVTRLTVLSHNDETARLWAWVKTGCVRKARPISFADAWIAAAALQLNVPPGYYNADDCQPFENLTNLRHRRPPTRRDGPEACSLTTGRPGGGMREWPARMPSFGCD
jgi:hypothetical protein